MPSFNAGIYHYISTLGVEYFLDLTSEEAEQLYDYYHDDVSGAPIGRKGAMMEYIFPQDIEKFSIDNYTAFSDLPAL